MTKKEFKRAMQCGLGRCVQQVHNTDDLEKYRGIILWGCTHELSFDAQCEGTRAWYLYSMVQCYADRAPFIEAAISCGRKRMTKDGWLFMQCIEFLSFFAMEGSERAYNALRSYYEQLYQILLRKRRKTKDRTMPERDNFEQLCIIIVNLWDTKEGCIDAYLDVVEDIGYLISGNPLFGTEDFFWFQSDYEGEFGKKRLYKALEKRAETSEAVREYVLRLQAESEKNSNNQSFSKKYPQSAEDIYIQLVSGKVTGRDIPISYAWMLSRRDDKKELSKLSDYYEKEANPEVRTNLLHLLANSRCADVLDVACVIADSKSGNEELKKYAFQALSYMRDERVREYALELLKDWKQYSNIRDLYHDTVHFEDIMGMLANNYQKEDYECLVSLVKQIPVNYYGEINWHSVYSSVRGIFKQKEVKNPPKELLVYMYEHSLCSCCREYFLREMSRRRMLTEDILRECLYDSNEDIQRFAKKKLEKINK